NIVDGVSNALTASFTTGESYTIDQTVPTVSSIVRADANPTNATTVNFTVTFSESVTGVDATNFTVVGSGVTGSVGTVTGSGTTWNVPVTSVSGTGTIKVDLDQNLANIVDGVSNALSASFTTGQSYTIDQTAPTVSSIVRADANFTNATTVNFTVTFSESVTGVDATNFTVVGSGVTGSVGTVTGSGTTWNVPVTSVSGTGTIKVDLDQNLSNIKDAVNNSLTAAFTTGESYTIDQMAPTVASITRADLDPTNATTVNFTVTFSEAVAGVDAINFTVVGSGVTGVLGTVTGSGTTWNVPVNSVAGSGTIKVNLDQNLANIVDAAFNPMSTPFTTGEFYTITNNFTFQISSDDGFTTDITTTNANAPGWFYSSSGGTNSGTYDSANSALRINQTAMAALGRFNVSGWTTTISDWLPYAMVGTGKVVRGKFFVYASGQTPNTQNIIPNLRLKLQNASAVACELEVLATNSAINDTEDQRGYEMQPSRNSSLPSLYRLDYDPVDVPYLASNGQSQGFGGIQRTFEAYSIGLPQVNGNLNLAQSVIGVYPSAYIADGAALADAPYRTYVTGPTGLQNFNGSDYSSYKITGISGNSLGTVSTAPPLPTIVYNSSTGVTMDTSVLASSSNLYVASADFSPIPKAGSNWVTSDYQTAVKVEEGKQYKLRFHMVSSRASNLQSQIRVRARSNRFLWAVKQEFGGAYPTNNTVNINIAAQTLPGIGCLNPDTGTLPSGTDGGWYTLIFHTPLSADIRPDVPGSISAKMPFLSSCPGPGVGNTAATTNENIRRMIFFGADVVDTLSSGANANLEGGNVTIDSLQVRTYDLLPD
ncbi:MAG: hypothetical protein K1X53_04860, partial [Candidatus Sumerlaeaceae bacterium]|nr:hypothetical protein [Candidatus Sumerlaeaceae bacterium]